MLKGFGLKVKQLRKEKKITQEDFCGDQSELSVRQLSRIEAGKSIPNLTSVTYIAAQLGVSIGFLTGEESLELPRRYKELKYLILRTPTYKDEERIQIREEQFDEIYTVYYDNLPENEQLAIDCLQAKLDVHISQNTHFSQAIIDDYFEQVKRKVVYDVNDLILIDLYLLNIYLSNENTEHGENDYRNMVSRLITQVDYLDLDDLFILNNILIGSCQYFINKRDEKLFEEVIKTCQTIMTKVQDFQKAPIVSMLEWKLALTLLQDDIRAKACFDRAILFANTMGDDILVDNLSKEWKSDNS
ncbi:helix-turn-helix domain-containing protein [Streptococcus loxodontisalivarius]|uniref:Transcriptional regulator with XRE-family HTH domain n=1 Tax=Streptococcus loxodontisalivarius TaxID=1349415 RepID=A0ABS2PT27_9STRE|nr:XRE family transcriptional regulator [Streptococcus loxodontisalivarius]MBM7643187.1 transcriptional regulator with XRE-family HTH domain [Streptococcus loxodontisalivarius]